MSSKRSVNRIDRTAAKWRGPGAGAWALVALTAIITTALVPARAEAGPSRYVFEMCDSVLPGGGVAGVIYAPHPWLPFYGENSCSRPNGALILRQGEIPQGNGGAGYWGIPISPPAGAALESITITAASCAFPPSAGNVLVGGWPAPKCYDDVRSFPLSKDFKGFTIELVCVDLGSPCHGGPWVAAHFFATTVIDPLPPSLRGLAGTLLADGIRRGRQGLAIEAEDEGGGVSSFSVAVNGLPAGQPKLLGCNIAQARNPSVIGTVAAQVTPCPRSAPARWTLDTGSFPFRDGANSVQVCASDFSTLGDPNTSCTAPQIVEVDSSCTESPVAGGEVLSAQFAASNAEQVTVGYGKGAEVIGRLANNAGDPIPGATLCLRMQTIGIDREPAAVGSVKTDANGRYRYEVAAGPNREVIVGYRHDTAQVAREVRYYAHARPSLKVSTPQIANGKRVRFWGQLPGPNGGGRVVVLQAGTVGSKRWITFRRATADQRGIFRAGYRFSSTTRRTRYHFRAVVPRQAGYPWVEGHSRPVEVLVGG
jgi:hypothetical protein